MADVITHSYRNGWADLGGGLALYFTLASSYNRYGCWGLTDDPANPDRNAKMAAVRALCGAPTSVHAVSDASPEAIISFHAYTVLGQEVGAALTREALLQLVPSGMYMIATRMLDGRSRVEMVVR